jgi:methylisocitrate lyase
MTTKLRELMASEKVPWSMAAYDGLTAKLVCEAGYDVIAAGGTSIAAGLGLPDVELYSVTENLHATRNIVAASTVPVIADIDTGYGNAINVMRTVREFEQIGCAGLILEDQVSPKICPAMGDAEILPLEQALGKVRAALAARTDPDFVIVARTDAVDVDEACRRVKAFGEAGADMVFTVNKCSKSIADLRKIRKAAGVPIKLHLMGWVEELTYDEIKSVAGVAGWGFPTLFTVVAALRSNLAAIHKTKSTQSLPIPMTALQDFKSFIGFPEIEKLMDEYMPAPAPAEARPPQDAASKAVA